MKGVYLVTDRAALRGKDLVSVVSEAVRAGVSCVQLREKHAPFRLFLKTAMDLVSVLKPAGIPLIINDRVDIALAAEADGVHLGQEDMPAALARRILGPKAVIGLSVETWEDVENAQALDVSYLGVSPVFPTPTKTDTKGAWGLAGLEKIRAFSRHPLTAIGSIRETNAEAVLRAGADALAVVSAVCSADDPHAATRRLVQIFQSVRDKEEVS